MKIKISEIPNPYILHQAREFRNATKTLKENKSSLQSLSVPIVVNAIFSLEMYLKSFTADITMYSIENSQFNLEINTEVFIQSHNPLIIFNKISEENKKIIEDKFKNFSNNEDIKDKLKIYENTFIAFRYPFDKKSKNNLHLCIDDLIELLDFFENTVNSFKIR